jgi:ParB/RepB/Spo0J family partition protein
MKELADSVKVHGVLEPILVRPKANGDPKHKYELVFGARRKRAAEMAKLNEIPAMVRAMSDLEVLETQAVENGQREDVHPLEEADCFKALHETHKKTVAEIAAKVGKSTSHVYGRLKLAGLCAKARDAFWEGKIDAVGALTLARIANPQVQEKAIKEIVGAPYPMVEGDVRRVVQRFTLRLLTATFNTTDASLIKGVGACGDCPKNSLQQRQLFGEGDREAICMDAECFAAKTDETWRRQAAAAEKGGAKVIGEKEAKKLFPYGGASLAHDAPFVDLAEPYLKDPKRRTYGQLLGKDAQPSVARAPDGSIRKLFPKAEVKKALKAAGHDFKAAEAAAPESKEDKAYAAQQKREREKQVRRRAVTTAVIAAVVGGVAKATADALYRLLVATLLGQGFHDAAGEVVKRRGWDEKGKRAQDVISRRAAAMKGAGLAGLLLELSISRGAYFAYADAMSDTLKDAAKICAVDVKKIQREIDKAAKTKPAKKSKR